MKGMPKVHVALSCDDLDLAAQIVEEDHEFIRETTRDAEQLRRITRQLRQAARTAEAIEATT